jgi:hypothetical protein
LPKHIPVLIFLLKFIGGIGVYLVYAKFYGERSSSDIFKYFDDGNIIHSSIYENPIDYIRMVTGIGADAPELDKYYHTCCFWVKDFNYGMINDNRTVIRFNALVRLISFGNFHIHTLFMSWLSFTGLWAIYKVFEKQFSQQKWLLLLMVFFFPSVYFWTSGVLKEGILMFAFGLFLYHLYNFLKNKKAIVSIIWMFTMVLLLMISKFYVFIAALPGIIFIILIHYSSKKYFAVKLISILLTLLLLSTVTKPLVGISFHEVLANKQNDFVSFVESMKYVGSKIDIPLLEPTMKSILFNSPGAFFRTLFRPSVFEVTNLMSFMAAFENLIIAVLLVFTAIYYTKKNLKDEWFWFSLLFVVILFTLSGLTTPVLGALVRYKAPALPFLGITFMYLINFEKVKKNIVSLW